MAERDLTPAEERERARLVARLVRQQERIEQAEVQQAQRIAERVVTVMRLKELGMTRPAISEATKDNGRLRGIGLEALDLAVKKYKRRQAASNGQNSGKDWRPAA